METDFWKNIQELHINISDNNINFSTFVCQVIYTDTENDNFKIITSNSYFDENFVLKIFRVVFAKFWL